MNTTTKLETNTRISTASTTKKTSMDDFTIIKLLGSGSYAQVILVKHNINGFIKMEIKNNIYEIFR